MHDPPKAVWSIPYVSVIFFPRLKKNFIAYRSSKVSWRPDCIFEIHQLWQSGFSKVHSNCCCSCSFEPEIIILRQSSHKIYSNNIVNFQVSTTILKACIKKSGNLLKAPRILSILLYGCTTWTLTKRIKKKPDRNCTRLLRTILNKSWKQHPIKEQLYGYLPPISKTIQIRRTRHAEHRWRSKNELISDVFL